MQIPNQQLNPFMSVDTTAVVARELGKSYVKIELNGDHVGIGTGADRWCVGWCEKMYRLF